MASLQDDDPAQARFRRGAGTRVGPPGPPPVPGSLVPVVPPTFASPPAFAPPPVPSAGPAGPAGPIATGTVPGWVGAPDPAPHDALFHELVGAPPAASAEPLYDAPGDAWLPVETDPGRPSGITSIVVGFFVGIVGLFIGVYSIRRSGEVGLSGAFGLVGVVVSVLSLLIVGAIGLSWLRYEVEVSQQCALVGPGHYLTQSGSEVTCR